MKILIIILMMCSICYADKILNDKVKIKEDGSSVKYFEDAKGRRYEMQEIQLVSDYKLQKPVIDEAKLLDKDESDLVEKTLKENGRRLIHGELKPAKNDYNNDVDRGTVHHTPKCHNYSFHKIIIPDGTIITEANFAQKEPHTQAIEGKNLTFKFCNLVNVEIDPTWKIDEYTNTCQIKRILKSEIDKDEVKELKISHQVEQPDKTYLEVAEDVEVVSGGDDYSFAILRLNK